jgi:hypothetical protein
MTQHTIECTNCGTRWFLEASPSEERGPTLLGAICPVCHLAVGEGETDLVRIASVTDLEDQLDTLVRSAWASGMDTEAIIQVLRGELAFAAEMGHAGRRFIVQLIDLGSQEEPLLQRPLRDRREILLDRGGNA